MKSKNFFIDNKTMSYTKQECSVFKSNGGKISPKTYKPLTEVGSNRITKYCNINYDNVPCANTICELTQQNINPYTLKSFTNTKISQTLKNSLLQKCLRISEKSTCDCVFTKNQQKQLKAQCEDFQKNQNINPKTGRKIKKGSKTYKELVLQCNLCNKEVDIQKVLESSPASTETIDDSQLQNLIAQLQEKDSEISTANEKISELEQSINEITSRRNDLLATINTYKQQLESLQNELQEKQSYIDDNYVLTRREYDALQGRIMEYDNLSRSLKDTKNQLSNVQQELNNATLRIKRYNESYNKLAEDYQKLTEQLVKVSSEKDAKDALISMLQGQIEQNNLRIQELEEAGEDEYSELYNNLLGENDALVNYIDSVNKALNVDIDESSLADETYLKDIKRLQLKLEVINNNNQNLKSEVANLNQRLAELEKQILSKDRSLSDLETNKNAIIEQRDLRIRKLEIDLDELSREINSLESTDTNQIKSLQKEVSNLSKRLNDANNLNKQLVAQNKQLTEANKYLKASASVSYGQLREQQSKKK